MAKLKPQERLQPSLLDRIIDDKPGAEKQEPLDRRVMADKQLRRAVLRDLAWLFNATRLESDTDLSGVPYVQRSVLNFGLPALSGRPESAVNLEDLELAIRQAILDFEPRILADQLEVRALAVADDLDHHNVIGVEIRGQIWGQPVPLELLVRTEIDLETGKVEIADLHSPRET